MLSHHRKSPSSVASFLICQDEVVKNVPEIKKYKVGLLHLFIQHTSAGLTLNEYTPSNDSFLTTEIGMQMSAKT
jgi:thiamine phosphate synthase YjbQ (UPF0047 family)